MTQTFEPQPRGGIAGLALLFCVVAGGAGLAFDFVLNSGATHLLVAKPGARALIGLGIAIALVAAAHILRRLLGQTPEEGSDA